MQLLSSGHHASDKALLAATVCAINVGVGIVARLAALLNVLLLQLFYPLHSPLFCLILHAFACVYFCTVIEVE